MLSPKYTLNNTGGHAPTYLERKPQAWSSFYHDNYAMAATLEFTSYLLWSNARIDLGLLDGKRFLSKKLTVTWNETKTFIQKATLVLSVNNDSFFGTTQMMVYLNGVEVARETWSFSGPYVYRLDVSGQLYNATNEFLVTYEKNPLVNPSATLTVSAMLEVEYSGNKPDPPPPLEELVNWVKDHPIEAAGATGVGMVAVAGAIYFRKKR